MSFKITFSKKKIINKEMIFDIDFEKSDLTLFDDPFESQCIYNRYGTVVRDFESEAKTR